MYSVSISHLIFYTLPVFTQPRRQTGGMRLIGEELQLKPSASHWMPHHQAINCSGVFTSGVPVAHSFSVRKTEFLRWYPSSILPRVNAGWSWLTHCMGIRGQQNPPQQKKILNNQWNTCKSHKPLLGSRLRDDAPLGGSWAADLAVRYQHRLLQNVLQDSYLAVAHTDTPSSKGT